MITIGITSYNYEQYLPDAIESALSQTVPCEVIVCDDGSTDNSLDIAKKYPVKVINQVNKGLPSARNSIIMNAAGEYILFLDADDILLENCAEEIEEAAKKYDADVIAPSFKSFGTYNEPIVLMVAPSLEDFKIVNRIGYFSAIKKSVLLEVGGYNPKMIWGWEDWDIWLDIFKRGKTLCTLQDVLVLYRTKEQSMLSESNKHAEELQEQMRKNHPELYV